MKRVTKSTSAKKSKSGRKERTQIEGFRARVWYWAVRHCSQLGDYRLDMLFGQEDGPITTGGAGRTRVFGVIKNKGTAPSRGKHPKRKFDLIKRVGEAYPETVGYFDSLIWELFALEPYDLKATNLFLNKCYKKLEVALIGGKSANAWAQYAYQQQEYGFEDHLMNRRKLSTFKMSMLNTLDSIPNDLDCLALFGALYRKYHLEFNHIKAEEVKDVFKKCLSQITESGAMERCGDTFKALATMNILCGRKGEFPTRRSRAQYDDEESLQLKSSEILLVSNLNSAYHFYRKNMGEISANITKGHKVFLQMLSEKDPVKNKKLKDLYEHLSYRKA
jgi:hypothetical protein